MKIWRLGTNRLLALSHGFKPLRVAVVVIVMLALAGCAGGARHESWPGLAVHEGTLYVSNLEKVQALNAETGKIYWDFPAAAEKGVGPFYAAPVLAADEGAHGVLLVAGFDRTVYALALGEVMAERPDEVWRFSGAGGQYVATGVVTDGLFVIGNGDGKVYALRMADGSMAWEFETSDRVWSAPLVIEDTIYITSLDHHLYALDRETGALQWSFETEGAVAATPIHAGGALWLCDFSSTLYQIDLETRDVVWTYTAEDWLWATPVLDGTILYFSDVSGNVYALNIADRSMVWDAPANVGDVVHGQPALNEDRSLLFVAGYEEGVIHAIDTQTGLRRESWGFTPQNPGRLPGDLVSDGQRLYAMPILVDARVQAFSLTAGDLLWSVPEAGE